LSRRVAIRFHGWGEGKDGHSVWFSIHGRNKLSIKLDLKKGRQILLKLEARADVLVENMRAEPLDAAITAWTRALPAKDAEEILERAEVPCSRLYDIADCANDPHFLSRKAVQPIDDPLIGPTLHPGPVIRMDGEAPEDVVRWTGPEVGAHTNFVLQTLLGLTLKST
jgi:formyl-CoA transferase